MRKIPIVAGGFVLVLAVLAGVALLFIDVNQFRPQIQNAMESRLRRTVALGPMSLKLFPLSIRIQNVAIGDNPALASQTPFLQANQMDVSVSLGALLSKNIEVRSLRIAQPKVELVKARDGKWNFESLSDAAGSGSSSASEPAASSDASFSLAELRIDDGQVAVTNQMIGKSRTVYDHIDLILRGFTPQIIGKSHLGPLMSFEFHLL